jgi:FAD/FMN-containing dehydrogenase/Fe-S oxidoreductase
MLKMENKHPNIQALIKDLNENIKGEVRFDPGTRALYATDGSNYRETPIGVVIPKSIQDVLTTVALCYGYGVPILSRGGGTSLAGQCCNVAVIIDFSKYLHQVLEVNPEKKLARIQPGCILDHMQDAAKKHDLIFGPDPATHTHNTLGGMIGNDSCGVHSLLSRFAGNGSRTADNIEELEILTYDGCRFRVGETSEQELEAIIKEGGRRGEIYSRLKALRDKYATLIRERFPKIPRRVSGYNLDQLLPENNFNVARALVGSEGTCVTILEATMKLVHNPKARSLMSLGYPDIFDAGDHVMEILKHKPSALEGIDELLTKYMRSKKLHVDDLSLLPDGKGWLIIEFGGESKEEATNKSHQLMAELKKKKNAPSMRVYTSEEAERIWIVRRSGLGATADVPGEHSNWPGWEDSAVPPDKVGEYLRQFKKLFKKFDYNVSLYGHFGDGCIHCRIPFDLKTELGITTFRKFLGEAANLVVSFGGSLSGEHGDGQSRAELLPIMFGEELIEAFREFKSIWDPNWKMNPGKKVDPNLIVDNLRLGTSYNPWHPKTHFHFPNDKGSFAEATLRCVGVGECRRLEVGTMCPSFRVTREEKYSTRGRARLLFEMLQGSTIGKKGWHDKNVKEALDLCLACKGCKHDCPVNVDMATYKSEFLSNFYAGRIRPRSAYAFGLIYWWSRVATWMPSIVNSFTQTPGIKSVVKMMIGMTPERDFPIYATQNFKKQLRKRKNKFASPLKVILWPDTFNNYFHPEVGMAAVEVLEAAGYEVIVPEATLCCGRPLYDFGFLDLAKHQLQKIIQNLRQEIRAGISIVGLEPSCVAVFRDELINLFPHDEDAKRLSQQTFFLSEFLEKKVENYQPPSLSCHAIVHGHCHHKSIVRMENEKNILQKMGLQFEILDSGCCGMAGSFGYEKGERYSVSMKVGEEVLLPTVRKASADTLIITDGFSCRNQIAGCTERRAIHMAELLQMGLKMENKTDET